MIKAPSDVTIEIYRIAMEESIAIASNFDTKLFEDKHQEMQKMLKRMVEIRDNQNYNSKHKEINIDYNYVAQHTRLHHRKSLKLRF